MPDLTAPDRPHLFLLPFLAATGRQWAGVAVAFAGVLCISLAR